MSIQYNDNTIAHYLGEILKKPPQIPWQYPQGTIGEIFKNLKNVFEWRKMLSFTKEDLFDYFVQSFKWFWNMWSKHTPEGP